MTNPEMSVIGWLIAAGVSVLLFPVVPFLAIGWVVSRLLNSRRSAASPEDNESMAESGVECVERAESMTGTGGQESREYPIGRTDDRDAHGATETTVFDEQTTSVSTIHRPNNTADSDQTSG